MNDGKRGCSELLISPHGSMFPIMNFSVESLRNSMLTTDPTRSLQFRQDEFAGREKVQVGIDT